MANLENKADEELMALYAAGNGEAFKVLYSRFSDRLYQFLLRRLGQNRRAETMDLFQMTWLKLHESKGRFDPSKKFSTWIFTIALNSLRDLVGRRKIEFSAEDLDSYCDRQILEEKLIEREQLQFYQDSLQFLQETSQEVLLLSDWEGFSGKEISEMLKISEGNVRQILVRARMKLKALMEQTHEK